MSPHEVIVRTVVSEKSLHLQTKLNQYTFRVHPKANKREIKDAIELLFKVKVANVTTMNCRGTWRRIRSAIPGMSAAWKKAIVRLADGQKIEGV
jgi:large subunit ribosomal protein L23